MEELKQKIIAQLKGASDLIQKTMHREQTSVDLMYVRTVADEAKVFDLLVTPFYNKAMFANYDDYVVSLPNRVAPKSEKEILSLLADGYAILLSGTDVYVYDVRKFPLGTIREATVETVIQGPLNAFSEDLGTNITLLRQRYNQPSLRVEKAKVGTVTQTGLTILYDSATADPNLIAELKRRIDSVTMAVVQSTGQLVQLLGEPKRSLFPRIMITERPDRATLNLSQGKVVLLMEGTAFALIAPSTFYDFLASMEDLYQQYFISRFLIILRYASLLISLTLPAAYVAVSAYNPEILRAQLALSIAGSRVPVPYPAFLEVLLMLLAMELLVEASIRLPKAIGSTATTVGGLILGTAATEASLVSSIMIIIVATVAISNFVVPINSMSFALRVAKYGILLFATLFGLIGIVLGIIALIGYLVSLESFGKPYMKLFENDDRHVKPTQRQPESGV
ncbi:spore germination protein [Paenibacillus sp.]|uniref:spore germination protein n=1 Tax=Paenibacillus sp. TaxID=58172 RepID=UPI00281282F4|nr:spore germination protein [Paenibacillus sp.]